MASTGSSVNDEKSAEDLPKGAITFAILFAAVVVGLSVAKLIDWCYKNREIRDDTSDMSDHTKDLLRTQLEFMRKGKKKKSLPGNDVEAGGKPGTEEHRASHAINVWSSKVLNKAKKLNGNEPGGSAADNGAFKSENETTAKTPTTSTSKPGSDAAAPAAASKAAPAKPSVAPKTVAAAKNVTTARAQVAQSAASPKASPAKSLVAPASAPAGGAKMTSVEAESPPIRRLNIADCGIEDMTLQYRTKTM